MIKVFAIVVACVQPQLVECRQTAAVEFHSNGECSKHLPFLVRYHQIIARPGVLVMGRCRYYRVRRPR